MPNAYDSDGVFSDPFSIPTVGVTFVVAVQAPTVMQFGPAKGKLYAPEGLRAVRLQKIKPDIAGGVTSCDPEKVEAYMREYSDDLPAQPFNVYWDNIDWTAGFVVWKEAWEKVEAMRQLGYRVIQCDVKIAPGSGLKLERKKETARIVVTDVPLTDEEREV